MRRTSGERPGPERKDLGGCSAGPVSSAGVRAIAARGWLRVCSAGSGKEGARRRALARTPGSGSAAMNLERLRKRVRQYLDQVGGPTRGARAAGLVRGARRGPFPPGELRSGVRWCRARPGLGCLCSREDGGPGKWKKAP